ncbi:hypothetical protein BVV00_12490 [Serratia sp. OMLW3]|nr:hypothetical protein BVV00_12490 [Serratia sp. OMLW3]PIJ20558.1 hypothetical protein BVU99_02940 [Serratia sp. OLAL2]
MTPDVTLSTYSYGFLPSYFSLSLITLVALYYLKKLSARKHNYPFFVFNCLIVVVMGVIQLSIFAYGNDFLNLFYPLGNYDSIHYGSLIFTFIYLTQLPKNTYYKKEQNRS